MPPSKSTAHLLPSDQDRLPNLRRRVVLAEDNEDFRELLGAVLVRAGYEVDSCRNGQEALELLSGKAADLVILDLVMPVMDGWQFRTAQRADPSIADVPVVVMTSETSPQATAIHADAYVRKPFEWHDLLHEIERVFLERERRAQAARLEETDRLALLGTVAAGVGHEINNPLSFAIGNLEIIDEAMPALRAEMAGLLDPSATLEQREAIERVLQRFDELRGLLADSRAGVGRVRMLVRNLRSLSARPAERRELLDLSKVVDASVSMASGQIKYRATLIRNYRDSARVLGDEGRLCQVFLNLLVNAAQSMEPDRFESNRISVSTLLEGDWSVVEIRDTGRGMSKTLQSRIYEPFFTTRGAEGGTGLGLSISKDLVAAHGGRIEAQSEPGRGSVFRVYLPLPKNEAEARLAQSAPPPVSAVIPTAPAVHPRVWVLDDEPLVGQIIARSLQARCEVWVASEPRELLARLAAGETFDVCCCDLMMPQMTGMEVRARIAEGWPQLLPRMIFVTGGPSTQEGREFISRPDVLVLDKPFDVENLRSTVQRVLNAAAV
ncbi:MAG TPA: response regulator [Polyangiaceae bacterium]|nr:response regulator [Polyangiaceae bacterium]